MRWDVSPAAVGARVSGGDKRCIRPHPVRGYEVTWALPMLGGVPSQSMTSSECQQRPWRTRTAADLAVLCGGFVALRGRVMAALRQLAGAQGAVLAHALAAAKRLGAS